MATNNGAGLRYRECLRNHGLSSQLYTFDGCYGFALGAEEGTPEAVFCAACGCHRNYHRREEEVVQPPRPRRRRARIAPGPLASPSLPPPPPSSPPPSPPPQPPAPPPRNARRGRSAETEVEIRREKKPKTKFTEEQRGRMREFAEEKLGWRIVKQDEEAIESFCEEIGITSQVFKVWINNNRCRLMKAGESYSAPKD